MNKETAKDYLPLVQALVDGKAVQIIDRDCTTWMDSDELDFRYPANHYRIKPEPREIWVNRTPCGVVACLTWKSEEEARKHAIEGTTPIRFREVLE